MKLPYPKSIIFIIANEFCERFSFYGMRAVLSLYLRNKLGYTDNGATVIFHVFILLCYVFPFVGAIIADGWLGRYRTILYISLIYACGSILISVAAMPPLHLPTIQLTLLSLLLIAIGTGGIKPCVSAFGGDQFKLPEQEKYLSTFFSIFYFSINAGSLISTFITPILRKDVHCFGQTDCYSLSFGLPGILMTIAIICFVAGKSLYIMKKPAGNILGRVIGCICYAVRKSRKNKKKRGHFLDHADDKYSPELIEDIKSLLNVLVLFIPVPIFWALFDQQGSRWTLQADRMRHDVGPFSVKADQMQLLNPLLILILIPLFEVAIYPALKKLKLIRKTLHRMVWGGLLAAAAFLMSGILELYLVPTYGTPVQSGLAQLRIYNGFNCKFKVQINNSPSKSTLSSLSIYESLQISANKAVEVAYSIEGEDGECAGKSYAGNFRLLEKTANSYFINDAGITNFVDNNEKTIDGVKVRFLANLKSAVDVSVIGDAVHKRMRSDNITQFKILDVKGRVTVGDKVVLRNYHFKPGAVYTINVHETGGNYVVKVVQVTPHNSVHILWQSPQYLMMTMGEVMFSVTGLEFSFTQAPASMKCILQSVWLITVAIGNLVVIFVVQGKIMDAQWKEFFLFAGLMTIDVLVFMVLAFRYKYVVIKTSDQNLPVEEMKRDN